MAGERKAEQRARLIREGRWSEYLEFKQGLFKEQLEKLGETNDNKKLIAAYVGRMALDRFGPGSLERWKRQKRKEALDPWRELAKRVSAKKRAPQRENYEWAYAHTLPGIEVGEVEFEDIPSRAAVLLLIGALEADDGLKDFMRRHQTATTEKAAAPKAADPEAIVQKDAGWIEKMLDKHEEPDNDRSDEGGVGAGEERGYGQPSASQCVAEGR